ncbi:MAG TPA: M3 family metallopeptidase, partial [Verrucomicrobiae bacterium]
MDKRILLPLIAAFALAGCESTSRKSTEAPRTFKALQRDAARHQLALTLPAIETSPAAAKAGTDAIIASGNRALDRIAKLDRSRLTLDNTVRALDDAGYEIGLVANRLGLIKETSPDPKLREAATEETKKLQDWTVGLDYREDVYATLKAYAGTHPKLSGEARRAFDETMRDYRRAGLELPKAQRDEVEKLRKELARKETDFQSNITESKAPVKFTRAEMEGVPEDFLKQPGLKTGVYEYTLNANITLHYIMVMENAKSEAARKRMLIARNNVAKEKNVALMNEIVQLRQQIAAKLGYKSWADFQTEIKMVKSAATAIDFMQRLKTGLQPKFDAELRAFAEIKQRETGDAKAKITLWDWRYFANQLRKQKYTVDTEALRVYFPYEKALRGMFDVYQTIFDVRIAELSNGFYNWHPSVRLFAVTDAKTGEPLGAFYLDMFPRDGKYNHFAQFPIIPGKRLPDGRYQRPVAALICNFPPPQTDKPSLLTHDEVETLFHEFGHCMHTMLTQAEFSRFSGTSVPGDFVEAPSQMLENWIWNKTVLDSFAADYRDPSKKIPAETIAQLKAAKLATIGAHYRGQLAYGQLDMALHAGVKPGEKVDCVKITNPVLSDTFLPVIEGTAFIAGFNHMAGGYDGGYYG